MSPTMVGERLIAGEREVQSAKSTLESLEGPDGFLAVGESDAAPQPLPRELGVLLQEVIRAMASGATVTVMSTPAEITTSTAAAMLGISRPTLMKLIRDGAIPAHKVGTHTRLLTDDVTAARRARRERERVAFAALLEAECDD